VKRILGLSSSVVMLAVAVLLSAAHAQRHGGGHVAGGLTFGSLCGSAATVDNGLGAIELMVKPTPQQLAALDELKAVAKANTDAMTQACAGAYPATIPERLAASEKRLDVALAGIRRLKPAAEKFYAALNDQQKKEANGLLILPGL
jgi:LTXXQ motif family protein